MHGGSEGRADTRTGLSVRLMVCQPSAKVHQTALSRFFFETSFERCAFFIRSRRSTARWVGLLYPELWVPHRSGSAAPSRPAAPRRAAASPRLRGEDNAPIGFRERGEKAAAMLRHILKGHFSVMGLCMALTMHVGTEHMARENVRVGNFNAKRRRSRKAWRGCGGTELGSKTPKLGPRRRAELGEHHLGEF